MWTQGKQKRDRERTEQWRSGTRNGEKKQDYRKKKKGGGGVGVTDKICEKTRRDEGIELVKLWEQAVCPSHPSSDDL